MRHGAILNSTWKFQIYSDRRHGHFLKSTCMIGDPPPPPVKGPTGGAFKVKPESRRHYRTCTTPSPALQHEPLSRHACAHLLFATRATRTALNRETPQSNEPLPRVKDWSPTPVIFLLPVCSDAPHCLRPRRELQW